MPDQRDIVLIPVPFTDLSSTKQRPVLVISSDAHNDQSPDIVVAAITSNVASNAPGVILNSPDMERGTLPSQSLVRADKLYTLSQGIVIKRYGKVKPSLLEQVFVEMDAVLGRGHDPI